MRQISDFEYDQMQMEIHDLRAIVASIGQYLKLKDRPEVTKEYIFERLMKMLENKKEHELIRLKQYRTILTIQRDYPDLSFSDRMYIENIISLEKYNKKLPEHLILIKEKYKEYLK